MSRITEQRWLENYVLSRPLKELESRFELKFLAERIQDHDHLREILMSEPDRRARYAKYHALATQLNFRAWPLDRYEAKEAERARGVMPELSAPSYTTNVYEGTYDPRSH